MRTQSQLLKERDQHRADARLYRETMAGNVVAQVLANVHERIADELEAEAREKHTTLEVVA